MCWNQGTWKFYMYYEQWERRAYEKAQEIISELKAESLELKEHREIDVIHKLNMICYREPGYLWKIKNKPFVWGAYRWLCRYDESIHERRTHCVVV